MKIVNPAVAGTMESSDIIISVEPNEGKGIENIELARQPLYTSKPEMERSGMGFTVMESFMNKVEVTSEPGRGTTVIMYKEFKSLNK